MTYTTIPSRHGTYIPGGAFFSRFPFLFRAAASRKIHVRESPYLYPRTLELRSPCPNHARSYKSCTLSNGVALRAYIGKYFQPWAKRSERASALARMINDRLPVAGMFEYRRECDEKYFVTGIRKC